MISLNSQGIADEGEVHVQLRPLAGAYELLFSTTFTVLKPFESVRWLTLVGARVAAYFAGGPKLDLGQATLDQPVILRQYEGPGVIRRQCQFMLTLQPYQIFSIESFRNGGNIRFELALVGTGGDTNLGAYEQPAQIAPIQARSAESDWVDQLRSAKALDILLVEVPMPFVEPSGAFKGIATHLRTAQRHFVEGDYRQCISECRQAMEHFEKTSYADAKKLLDGDKNGMTVEDREQILTAMVHHYTQQAAHSKERGGYLGYSRADAKLALTLVAAFAAHKAQRELLY